MKTTADLATVVASQMGPADVDSLLQETMQALRRMYPFAKLHHMALTFSVTQRAGEREEVRLNWRVQVGNERGSGDTRSEAFEELAEDLAHEEMVPAFAARIAEVLREVPDHTFVREHVVAQAKEIVDAERRNRR